MCASIRNTKYYKQHVMSHMMSMVSDMCTLSRDVYIISAVAVMFEGHHLVRVC